MSVSGDGVNADDSAQVRVAGPDTFVTQWKDFSTSGKHATNATVADQPKYIANGLNGKPVLRFAQDNEDNGDRLYLGDLSADFPTAGSVFVVSTIDNDGRYNLFGNRNNDERWVASTWSESRPGSFREGRSQSANFTMSDWPTTGSHVFALESSSSAFKVLIDGASIGTDTPAYNSGSGQNWTIGNRATNGQQLRGDIAELILFNRILTPAEVDKVGGYLMQKYGLTTAYPPLYLAAKLTSPADTQAYPFGTSIEASATVAAAGTPPYTVDTITAEYSGHGVFAASSAPALAQVVNMAPLTVTANNVFRPSGTDNPDPLPYKITGYQNGENRGSAGVFGEPMLTTAAVPASPAGNHDITCALGSLEAYNYSFTLVNGTLTVADVPDTFSVNFFGYGGLTTDEQKANVLIAPGVPAGLSDWFTSGWKNFEAPWAPTSPLAPVTLTSNRGSMATFKFNDCRNGWTYAGARTTLLGDGNGNMMDGHVNSTLDPGDGSNLFNMEVSNIPFAAYDMIFYMGANQAQFGDGTGKIVFNGGAEHAFTLKSGAFDGTFTEMVDATTKGNYIVFKGVTGATFTTRTWGTGPTGFNHVGPFGFQIRPAAAGYGTWAVSKGISGEPASGDYDTDGLSNLVEYALGKDPKVSSQPAGVLAGNTLTFTKGTDAIANGDVSWAIETSTDLGVLDDWTPVESQPAGDPSLTLSHTFTPSTPVKDFARLKVTKRP